jgi:hypothetical protein
LRGIRKKIDEGRCPLCLGGEDVQHILLNCTETVKQGTEFLNKISLNTKGDVAYKKILIYANIALAIDLGRYLKMLNLIGLIQ